MQDEMLLRLRFSLAIPLLTASLLGLSGLASAEDRDTRPTSPSTSNGSPDNSVSRTGNRSDDKGNEDRSDGNNDEGSAGADSRPQAAIASLPGNGSGTQSGGGFSRLPDLDQQQAKIAIQQGQAASMSLLLAYLKQSYPGEVLDVKLHGTSGGLVYEVRYLSNVIFLHTVYLDALTLKSK
jgi:hypothetical protein